MTVSHTPAPISRGMERGILILFMAAATVMGLIFLLPAIRHIVEIVSGSTPVNMLVRAPLPHESASDAAVSSTVAITSGSFDSASIVATGLSDGVRALIAIGVGFGALTAAATVGAVTYFLFLLMWKRPFHKSLIVATQVAGASLLLGGMLSAGLGGLGRMMAATELNPLADDVFVVGFSFDPNVLLAGLAVLALSFVFSYGTRLQRDTVGLV